MSKMIIDDHVAQRLTIKDSTLLFSVSRPLIRRYEL